MNDEYKSEESNLGFGYPPDYKPKEIIEQVECLRKLFPELKAFDLHIANNHLPEGAEGWFAIPRWEKIAPTYNEAIEIVLEKIKLDRNGVFFNYHQNQFDSKHLRQSEKLASAFCKIGQEQKNYDILIVPAQFGKHHNGRSVRRAHEVMSDNEFGLGVYEIGIMILTHPERFTNKEVLWIICAGNDYHYSHHSLMYPCFHLNFDENTLGIIAVSSGYSDVYNGIASGFLT